jgi:hypothetical protein
VLCASVSTGARSVPVAVSAVWRCDRGFHHVKWLERLLESEQQFVVRLTRFPRTLTLRVGPDCARATTSRRQAALDADDERQPVPEGRPDAGGWAVAHSLLLIVYHVLARRAYYRELGGDYFDRQQHQT